MFLLARRVRGYHLLFALIAISASLASTESQQQQQACEVGNEGHCAVNDDSALDIATCKDAREDCQEWAEVGTQFDPCRYNLFSKLKIVQEDCCTAW